MAKKTAAKKPKTLTWPNGKKVAVSITVMFETWPDDSAPSYSVQTTHLKKGTVDHAAKAWSTYGGRVGVWRLIRTFERLGMPATFFVNARCTEVYPDAVKQIAGSGFDLAAHSYTQDDLPSYFPPEEQDKLIRKSIDMLESCSGKKVTGWGSPVVAFTPETAGLLKQNGLKWTCDVTYADLPIKIHTPHGPIAGVPTTDFSDNRVLRASSARLVRRASRTFDYLRQHETIGLQTLVIHTQFGGRPLITAVLTELLKYMQKSRDVWFTTACRAGRLGAQAGCRRAHLPEPVFPVTPTLASAVPSLPARPLFRLCVILSENRCPLFGITLFLVRDLVRKPVPTFRDHALQRFPFERTQRGSHSLSSVIAGLDTASRVHPTCGSKECGTRAGPSSGAIHLLRKTRLTKRMDHRTRVHPSSDFSDAQVG